jgi:hypothetical protein
MYLPHLFYSIIVSTETYMNSFRKKRAPHMIKVEYEKSWPVLVKFTEI